MKNGTIIVNELIVSYAQQSYIYLIKNPHCKKKKLSQPDSEFSQLVVLSLYYKKLRISCKTNKLRELNNLLKLVALKF